MNQTEVAFLDEIEKRQATVDIAARNLDDQPEVALDHALARLFIPAQGTARVFFFFFRREQRRDTYLVEVSLYWIQQLSQNFLPLRQGATAKVGRLSRWQISSRINRLSVAPDLEMQSRLA